MEQWTEQKSHTEFQKKLQKAFSTIVLAITTPQLYLVTLLREARDALHDHCERDALANKLFLKSQYLQTEMRGLGPRSIHIT